MCKHRLTWREVRRALVGLGARARRARGSHETWVLPTGHILVLILGRENEIVPRHVQQQLVHLRRSKG
jgi:predicted RNA binding protein YcfA (HicA-like mRNA interferase family)